MAAEHAEHEATRAALRAVIPRLAQLLRSIADMDAPSGVPPWTVGDVGAHLRACYLAYCSAFTHEFIDWDRLLPPGDSPLIERITEVNARAVALFGTDQRLHAGDFVAEHGEMFLQATEGLAPDTPVNVPWYGKQLVITLGTATGLVLSESLLHGLDIARGARLPWTIAPGEARLVLGRTMPAMMPLVVNTAKAQGVSIAFDLAITGGPRLAVVVDDGTATVTRDASPRRYDCRIMAAPTPFLLVSYRRMPLWKAIATGRVRAGGRKPWLGPRLAALVSSP
ncbi:maleylpyruvate isomerase N-terminal domain-containing protein [Streptomyces sp. RB6PN25]|uniref:Maleylpyruvate isomerase N-terminal domain-containing protein n=1 Tax=Streptomyces humicola TaxID=2953240 RepID=A0ABT1PYU3_9ACTN|nr:maleylpyruvate isomerase N-terminal domain-containing protein [Streptomyces humicola]MCQ4081697.1 maleylpyruvate isomerase N-terminal domain-containing protein [Streptomyces humicola]